MCFTCSALLRVLCFVAVYCAGHATAAVPMPGYRFESRVESGFTMSCHSLLPPMTCIPSGCCGRYLVADRAPIWQRPLVSLSQLFLKTPAQVRAHQQASTLAGMSRQLGSGSTARLIIASRSSRFGHRCMCALTSRGVSSLICASNHGAEAL